MGFHAETNTSAVCPDKTMASGSMDAGCDGVILGLREEELVGNVCSLELERRAWSFFAFDLDRRADPSDWSSPEGGDTSMATASFLDRLSEACTSQSNRRLAEVLPTLMEGVEADPGCSMGGDIADGWQGNADVCDDAFTYFSTFSGCTSIEGVRHVGATSASGLGNDADGEGLSFAPEGLASVMLLNFWTWRSASV